MKIKLPINNVPINNVPINSIPIIINVPHASTYIPDDETMYFNTDVLQHEITVMTDHYCDDLFCVASPQGKNHIDMHIAKVSRLVCDTERFRNDADEMMSKKGMGAVYTKTSDGGMLRTEGISQAGGSSLHILDVRHKEFLLKKYYDSYHEKLTLKVSDALRRSNSCLIIDGHSFYPTPLPYEFDQTPDRADICIGTDEFHTPMWLTDSLKHAFEDKRYTVSVNTPFSGTMVPLKYYGKDKRVMSIMIELNRRLYIDENAGKTPNYARLKEDLREIICSLKCTPFDVE